MRSESEVTQILKQELEALEMNSSFFLDKTAKEKRAFAITVLRAALTEQEVRGMRYKSEMTPDDITRMARESGFAIGCVPDEIYEFAELVAAAEREACAKVADEWATREQKQFGNGGPAAAIRARGEK